MSRSNNYKRDGVRRFKQSSRRRNPLNNARGGFRL